MRRLLTGAYCDGDDVGDDWLYTPPPPRHEDDMILTILILGQRQPNPKKLTWAVCILLFASLSQVHNHDDGHFIPFFVAARPTGAQFYFPTI